MGRVASPRVRHPLPRRTTGEQVAEHVRQLVFTGELRPGDRIPQADLAADLGVSRLPVREAVIELARDGLVTMEPHSGAFVAPFDAEVLRHHFEIVGLVQGIAAEALVEHPDAEAHARLATLADKIDVDADAGNARAVHASTMEFLRVLNLAGGSARQQSVLRALARMLPTGFFAEVPGAAESERRGAHQILRAIESGSRSAAQRACVEVQRAHAELVIEYLWDRGVLDPPTGWPHEPGT
ncbi:MAG: GntR family transcriptional regulator [Acidimicrobiia bacterium]|jgi:DNA-binding GntR family transcriptional regulator